MIRYFNKPMEKVTIEELRKFLFKYLTEERKLSDRTINYYNSIIRFVYEVTLDKLLNKKQIPMRKQKKNVYKVLTKEELSTFFNIYDNYKFKTIFMLIYGTGLRIGEVVNLRKEDIDSKKMRIFVREGKGNKERYTILPKAILEMLREYWKKYRPKVKSNEMFMNANQEPINQYVIRTHFRKYRKKAGINEKVTVHTLRHCFATDLIERGATLIQVKELMGHSNIRSTMAYVSKYRPRIGKSIRCIFEGGKIKMTNIQKILEIGLEEYLKENKVIVYKQKVITAIKNCKTGSHKYKCDKCGHEEIAYNSCRNRHCPNCQTGKKLKWIEAIKEEVLNIKYYHVVFTIPSEIYKIAIQNQEKIYKIMFKASAETLQELAEDKKYLGGEIGFFSILHTWGQYLMYHPHIHLVVTGGGLSKIEKWVEKKEDFFIPVQVMSRKFRGKFLSYMKKEYIE